MGLMTSQPGKFEHAAGQGPSTPIPCIPREIWIHIAKYIPSKDLRNLYSLNSLFLDLALDERYSEISFQEVDEKTLMFLEHMRDSNLSSRVRHMRVGPSWLGLNAIEPKPPRTTMYCYIAHKLSMSFNNWRMKDHRKVIARRKYIDNLTTNLMVQFSSLTTLTIVNYSHLPEGPPLFLSNSWKTFGPNLSRLTINAPLAGFATLLPSLPALVSLTHLTIQFLKDILAHDPSLDTYLLTTTIFPFLKSISPQLRAFNLISSALGDHSSIFHALDDTPYLTTLSLTIGFYPRVLSNTSGVTKFLSRNAHNLQHVKLQPLEPFETFRFRPPIELAHDHFSSWMNTNIVHEGVLSNLQTLVVLPSTKLGPITRRDCASLYIPRSRDTLTNLILGGLFLSFAELMALVAEFEHRTPDNGVKVLHVKVSSLSPRVFDLLAEKLVGLDDLDIKFNVLLDDVQHESPRPVEDEEPTEEVIAAFLSEMSNRLYPDWMLYSLWIWQKFMTTNTTNRILTALKPSIPSLKVILETDHTDPLLGLFPLSYQ